jgi:hypothetical protein
MTAVESETCRYRGFLLEIDAHRVVIVLDGRKLAVVRSVSEARRFVRGYRRAERRQS